MNPTTASAAAAEAGIDRRDFVARLLAACPDALVVTGLGSPTYDVCAAGDSERCFYLWGAMGGSTTLALGLALAQPSRPVLVITGDGEQLMGLGALATVAAQQPANLAIVVLDNGRYGETGGQSSHSGLGLRLAAVAQACGIGQALVIDRVDEAESLAQRIRSRSGPLFAQVRVRSGELPRALPMRDGVELKNRLRRFLGHEPL